MIYLVNQEKVLRSIAERLAGEYSDQRVFIDEGNGDGFTVDFTPTVPDGVRIGYVLDYGEKQSIRRKELQQFFKVKRDMVEEILACPVYFKESTDVKRYVKVTADRRFGVYQIVRLNSWKDEEELVNDIVLALEEYMEAILQIR